uniref:Uncharacterized protein n=1 Tax=Mesocestoides corti TaxID=53468 RepID=A0A5K3F639_MESCO
MRWKVTKNAGAKKVQCAKIGLRATWWRRLQFLLNPLAPKTTHVYLPSIYSISPLFTACVFAEPSFTSFLPPPPPSSCTSHICHPAPTPPPYPNNNTLAWILFPLTHPTMPFSLLSLFLRHLPSTLLLCFPFVQNPIAFIVIFSSTSI